MMDRQQMREYEAEQRRREIAAGDDDLDDDFEIDYDDIETKDAIDDANEVGEWRIARGLPAILRERTAR
jgi:hypothetical protein